MENREEEISHDLSTIFTEHSKGFLIGSMGKRGSSKSTLIVNLLDQL